MSDKIEIASQAVEEWDKKLPQKCHLKNKTEKGNIIKKTDKAKSAKGFFQKGFKFNDTGNLKNNFYYELYFSYLQSIDHYFRNKQSH